MFLQIEQQNVVQRSSFKLVNDEDVVASLVITVYDNEDHRIQISGFHNFMLNYTSFESTGTLN